MKIPIVTATTDIPTSIPGSESAGMEWGAARGLGHNLQGLALQISEEGRQIREKFKAAEDHLTLVRTVSDMSLFNQQKDRELDSDPNIDPLDRQQTFINQANAKKQEILKDIPDEVLRKRAEAELDKNITMAAINQGSKGYKKNDEKVEAETQAEMLRLANTGDFAGLRKLADFMVAKGLRTPQWANETVDKHTEIGEKAIIATQLSSDNLDVLRGLKSEIDKAKKLNPLEKAIYKAEVTNKIRALEEKEKKEQKEVASTNAFNDLKTTYGNDYDLALKALATPEYAEVLQKKYPGLDLAGIAAIRTALHNEKNIRDEETKKTQDNTAAENFVNIDQLVRDSTKGLATIKKQVDDKLLDWRVGEHFKNVILNPPEIKSDPAEYLSILKDLAMDRDKGEITGRILASKGLSITDKKTLGNEVYRQLGGENKDWLMRARQFLESQIIPKFGIMEKIARTPKEEESYYNAIKALDQKLEDTKKGGKPIEGQEILTLAQQMVPVYQRPIAEKILDRVNIMKSVGQDIKTKMEWSKEIEKKAKKYKTEKEVGEDYSAGKLTYEEAAAILASKFGAASGNH